MTYGGVEVEIYIFMTTDKFHVKYDKTPTIIKSAVA
jgi:hypothetical protein